MNLHDKVCVVTGGTKGIGAATALSLVKEGAHLAIVARHNDSEAVATKKSIESLGRRCEIIVADCAKPADNIGCIEEAAARLG